MLCSAGFLFTLFTPSQRPVYIPRLKSELVLTNWLGLVVENACGIVVGKNVTLVLCI